MNPLLVIAGWLGLNGVAVIAAWWAHRKDPPVDPAVEEWLAKR